MKKKKKSSVIFFRIFLLIFVIGISTILCRCYIKGIEDNIVNLGIIILILSTIPFAMGMSNISVSKDNYVTKKQIKKFTHISVIARVSSYSPVKDEKKIFHIRYTNGVFDFLKEKENLDAGETYIVNNKNEWEKVEI